MCKYKLQEFFWRKTRYQEYCLIECYETSRKLNNIYIYIYIYIYGSLLFEAMIDTWTFKILIKKIMNLTLLFIVTWKSKDESHNIIKLLSIIIPIFIQQTKFQPLQTSTKKIFFFYKKLFLFKTIILSCCEEVDISKK